MTAPQIRLPASGTVWLPDYNRNVERAISAAFSDYTAQASPTALTASATLTVTQLLTRMLTVTSAAAVSLTLPTGALTDAGILRGNLAADQAFEWVVVNLGSTSGAVTMVAGTGHTLVGSATVSVGTSAVFRTRKTAAATFITYRIG